MIHINSKMKTKLPEFPQKSVWDFVSDKEGNRLNKFNVYFPEILNNKELMNNEKVFNLLTKFVSEGEVTNFL